ncbi:FAD-binding oxidoreductase [Acidicapsa dinghuensis]|uniref:D-lactate dehydrogenase (cytochrome) n=1 Tax=Acidicapsa dinghuensis TaxID=2218256 RepID=A0ABW1EJK8_9BACT|nr:FAD-linked oxidase C-terminal domain-containing protein [Acidicapsa dinghuensis]
MAAIHSISTVEAARRKLHEFLGERVSIAQSVREHHSHGEDTHPPALPDLVCFPHSTEEVSRIARVSAEHGLPIVPFGAGTSLEGHVQALRGGISIDMREMNRVLRISADDMDATVEAGVTRKQLQKALENTGLTFFIDPGADATLGGMAATRASGTTAVKYGTMRENVLGLTVVLADGRAIQTGTRARKSSAGYDLTRLFVGSEGTLGIITEVTLRLHAQPEAVTAAICAFESIEDAVKTVIEAIQLGVSVARIEFMDEHQVDAVNRYSHTGLKVKPTLLFEFHGVSQRAVEEAATMAQELAAEHGGLGFEWRTTLAEREELWKARHDVYYATRALRPGSRVLTTDVCVPISRLAECIVETRVELDQASFPAVMVGHVGDGNFHVQCLLDESQLGEAAEFSERLVERAQAMGGTCSGEHGIGLGKKKYLEHEHGAGVDVMRAIKRTLDPENRMNPGKVLDI